jgi:hypothetical protein
MANDGKPGHQTLNPAINRRVLLWGARLPPERRTVLNGIIDKF